MACDAAKKAAAGQQKHRLVLVFAFAPVGYAQANDDDDNEQCRQKNDSGTRKTSCCKLCQRVARQRRQRQWLSQWQRQRQWLEPDSW